MNISTYRKRFGHELITLSVAVLCMHGSVALAQEKQSSKSKPAADRRVMPQVGPAQAQALDQLSHQIEGLQFDLPRVRERFGPNHPNAVQFQKELEKLLELQKRFLQLSQGESNENTKAEISRLVDEISAATAFKSPESSPDQLAGLQQELQQMKQQLAEREKQFAAAAKQLAEERRPSLPPLENGTIKVFRLMYAQARDASKTVESLFGSQRLRVAVDERSNSLLVYGTPDVLTALDALLPRLDEQASPKGFEKTTQGTASPRSLLVRVFWLADNLPETAGQNPADFLPKSVLAATHKLGLEAPRLVTQTVNSLATGKDDSVDFSTSVPAVLLEQPVGMGCEGKLKLVSDDRVRVDMGVHVGGPSVNCELRGSMATPLGHYMVLGTANSMIAEGGNMAGGMPGAPGIAMGRGAMGPEGGPGQPAGGFRGGARLGPAAGAAAPGGVGPGGEFAGPGGGVEVAQPSAKPKFETSRFAFVVQVIEGQSYEAEKTKADGE